MRNDSLRVADLFYSIQGEGSFAGEPAIFLRLQGCNLRCPWCDEPNALTFNSTPETPVDEVAKKIWQIRMETGCNYVVFTGGEPTAQGAALAALAEKLFDQELGPLRITVETNGTLPRPKNLPALVTLSPKTKPGGKPPHASMLESAYEVKLVIERDTDIEAEYQYYRENTHVGRMGELLDRAWLYLMPEDSVKDEVLSKITAFVLAHPKEARVCLRQHKLMGLK